MSASQLRRVRWAVRLTLALGVVVSISANVLHAEPNPIAEAIAAWPPLALLLTVELISRVPVHRRWLGVIRMVATGFIASIAAYVSYLHMAGVALRYGERGAAPYLIPLSVDGLVVVASVCLVEIAGRLRDVEDARKISDLTDASNDQGVTLGSTLGTSPVPVRNLPANHGRDDRGSEPSPTLIGTAGDGPVRTPEAEQGVLPLHTPAPVLVEPVPPAGPLPEAKSETGVRILKPPNPSSGRTVSTPRRNPELTRRLVIAATVDGLKPAEIAESLGLSVRRVNQLLKPVPDGGERS